MMLRTALLGLLVGFTLVAAAPKATPEGKYRAEEIQVSAKLYLEKDAIRSLLGAEPGPGIAVVEISVAPLNENGVKVFADDFFLKSDKDGQRSQPYSPSQIAGRSTLVVSTSGGRGVMMGDDRGPVWGGIGGGRPGASAPTAALSATLRARPPPLRAFRPVLRIRKTPCWRS